jgi:catechol 2,3-dioxygenase-like lactoylglutathione lyase family enzyme
VLRHVTLSARDLPRSLAFYDATLGALGLVRYAEFGDEEEGAQAEIEAVAYCRPAAEPVLWVVAGPGDTCGVHLALSADGTEDVDAFYQAALAHGGSARQAPRRWEVFRAGYYGAQVADPAGNLVEAVSRE